MLTQPPVWRCVVHVYIGAWEGFGGGRAAVRGRKPRKVQVSPMKKRAKLILFFVLACCLGGVQLLEKKERERKRAEKLRLKQEERLNEEIDLYERGLSAR